MPHPNALTSLEKLQIVELHLAGFSTAEISRKTNRNAGTIERTITNHYAKGVGQQGRCPKCGGWVVLPCLGCAVARRMRKAVTR